MSMPSRCEPLRRRVHLIRVEYNSLDAEALAEVEQRLLDCCSKSIGSSGSAGKRDANQARLLSVQRHSNDRRQVVLDAGINADPHRQQMIG